MPVLPFASQAADRGFGLLPQRLQNLFVEATPEGMGGSAHLPRPGLALAYAIGTGPIRGMYQRGGVFGGDRFAVSGSQLYREGAIVGAVSGSGNARFAASPTQLVVVADGKAWCYDGAALARVADADLEAVSDVAYLAGRFVYLLAGTGRFVWSAIADATSIDPLAFNEADSSPDPGVALETLGDELYVFGTETVEIFQPTLDIDAPFQRVQGRAFDKGCAAPASIVRLDNTAFYLGSDFTVYRIGASPQAISTNALGRALADCEDLSAASAFAAPFQGHVFYVLNVPGQGSFAYDAQTQRWGQWTSQGRALFRGRCGVVTGRTAAASGDIWLGDDEVGKVYRLSAEALSDDGAPIVRLASAFLPLAAGRTANANATLTCVAGVGNSAAPAPVAELRYSDDQGRTWSAWKAASMGAQGHYRERPAWRMLGAMRAPGRAFEVRSSDPVIQAWRHLTVNAERA